MGTSEEMKTFVYEGWGQHGEMDRIDVRQGHAAQGGRKRNLWENTDFIFVAGYLVIDLAR